eukprot:TRINITY_DN9114_c0_g1_i1.p1 TRINITY_DN9114_c0_g1~~TRINITY_DN9114_c0_g1_i1.p1  ORF type:complete len:235 (-),score=35.65 TRINITY_DN9114_c0_g1_i1:29-733(-)
MTNGNHYKTISFASFVVILIILPLLFDKDILLTKISAIIDWIHSLGWIGPLVLSILHILAVSVCFPGTVLFELGAGLLFGIFGGVLLVSFSKSLGGSIGFLLGRYLFSDFVRESLRSHRSFDNIRRNVGRDMWSSLKFATLLRLSPLPSWINNYGLAVTSIEFPPFFIATLVGSLPTIFQNVYMGSCLQSLVMIEADSLGWSKYLLLAISVASSILIGRITYSYAQDPKGSKGV